VVLEVTLVDRQVSVVISLAFLRLRTRITALELS
jgi:hypothetical protein